MNPAVSRFHLQLEMPFPSDAVLQADCLRPESSRLQHLRGSPQKVLLHCLLCFSPSQDSWCCWGKAVRLHMCPQWVHKAAPGLLQPACGRCLTQRGSSWPSESVSCPARPFLSGRLPAETQISAVAARPEQGLMWRRAAPSSSHVSELRNLLQQIFSSAIPACPGSAAPWSLWVREGERISCLYGVKWLAQV